MKITKFFSKSEFHNYLKNQKIFYSFYSTNAGKLTIFFTDLGIFHSTFDVIEIPKNYIFTENFDPEKLILIGTNFQIKVWETLIEICKNKISTYKDLAIAIEQPNAFRAIGNALSKNQISYFVPCHKIIRQNKELGGYKWGLNRKSILLKNEKLI